MNSIYQAEQTISQQEKCLNEFWSIMPFITETHDKQRKIVQAWPILPTTPTHKKKKKKKKGAWESSKRLQKQA